MTVTTLLYDDFNRSNRDLDGPLIGPAATFWRYGLGTGKWWIRDNTIKPSDARPENRVYWDIGETAYTLRVDLATLPSDGGICVRSDGAATEVLVYLSASTHIDIYTYDGDDYTLRVTGATGTAMADGDTVTVVVTSSAVTATSSGGLTATWASTMLNTQTQVGLRENNNTVGRFDNLLVGVPVARYRALEVLPGSETLANVAIVTRDGLDDVRAADVESVAVYGHRAVTVDVALASDADAADLADFHANRRSVPAPVVTRVEAVIPREDVSALEAMAELDLGSLVRVERTTADGRPLVFSATVEAMEWDLAPGRQSLALATAPSDTYGLYGSASWFVVGESLLGGTAVLAPY